MNFDGIVEQIDQHLPQSCAVCPDAEGSFRSLYSHRQSLPGSAGLDHTGHIRDEFSKITWRDLEFGTAHLDLCNVQQVIYKNQEMLAASVDNVKIVMLLF